MNGRWHPYGVTAAWCTLVAGTVAALHLTGILTGLCELAGLLGSLFADTSNADPMSCGRSLAWELFVFGGRGPLAALVTIGLLELRRPPPTVVQTAVALIVPPLVVAVSIASA